MGQLISYNYLFDELKCCVVIPTYNNSATLLHVIKDIQNYTSNIIVVNDGSTDNTAKILADLIPTGIIIINNDKNKGKGAALKTGFAEASKLKFKYALTIDSDGQHLASDIPNLINKLKEEKHAVIIGSRDIMASEVPGRSSFGRKFSNFWFKFETGINISDTQSGFRIYPLKEIKSMKFITNKYDFEIDVLVRLAWKGIKIITVPVTCVYLPEESRISHFKPVRDFTRVSILNTILVFLSVFWFKPVRFIKSLSRENIKRFINENVLRSKDSNLKLSVSLAVGLFMGIIPIWGWQLAIAIPLAIIMKLNKVIVITAANISIPPNIPIILFLSYYLGGLIIGNHNSQIVPVSGFTFEFVYNNLYQYIIGAITLAISTGLFAGFASFFFLNKFRKHGKRI